MAVSTKNKGKKIMGLSAPAATPAIDCVTALLRSRLKNNISNTTFAASIKSMQSLSESTSILF